MGFFKDLKEDLSQAVNELLPDENLWGEEYDDSDFVNTLDDSENKSKSNRVNRIELEEDNNILNALKQQQEENAKNTKITAPKTEKKTEKEILDELEKIIAAGQRAKKEEQKNLINQSDEVKKSRAVERLKEEIELVNQQMEQEKVAALEDLKEPSAEIGGSKEMKEPTTDKISFEKFLEEEVPTEQILLDGIELPDIGEMQDSMLDLDKEESKGSEQEEIQAVQSDEIDDKQLNFVFDNEDTENTEYPDTMVLTDLETQLEEKINPIEEVHLEQESELAEELNPEEISPIEEIHLEEETNQIEETILEEELNPIEQPVSEMEMLETEQADNLLTGDNDIVTETVDELVVAEENSVTDATIEITLNHLKDSVSENVNLETEEQESSTQDTLSEEVVLEQKDYINTTLPQENNALYNEKNDNNSNKEIFYNKEEDAIMLENTTTEMETTETKETVAATASETTGAVQPSDETTVISKATRITGSISSDCSLEVLGTIEGNVECLGKLSVVGTVKGNCKGAEVYINTERLNGNIESESSVKIGVGTVVIGDVNGTSAVIAGAVKGEVDISGPVVIDSTAIIKGNINAKSIQINNGAVIDGYCSLSYASIDIDNFFEAE